MEMNLTNFKLQQENLTKGQTILMTPTRTTNMASNTVMKNMVDGNGIKKMISMKMTILTSMMNIIQMKSTRKDFQKPNSPPRHADPGEALAMM